MKKIITYNILNLTIIMKTAQLKLRREKKQRKKREADENQFDMFDVFKINIK
jgi:hypothetical protein